MKVYFTAIAFLFLLPLGGNAQFVHFQMNVQPELSAEVIQNLYFGQVITNSGSHRINKGDPNMGIFEIRTLRNQNVIVQLSPPKALSNSDTTVENQIPLSLQASYTNTGTMDASQSKTFSGNSAWFTIGDGYSNQELTAWESAYVFVYGSISIGDIPDGIYSGTLVLTVEYQ